jgi:hypothetical protein
MNDVHQERNRNVLFTPSKSTPLHQEEHLGSTAAVRILLNNQPETAYQPSTG